MFLFRSVIKIQRWEAHVLTPSVFLPFYFLRRRKMIFKGLVFAIDNFLSNKELRLDAFLTCLPIFKDVSSHSFTILARYLPNIISYCPSQEKSIAVRWCICVTRVLINDKIRCGRNSDLKMCFSSFVRWVFLNISFYSTVDHEWLYLTQPNNCRSENNKKLHRGMNIRCKWSWHFKNHIL